MDRPSVTFVIPCFNHGEFVGQAVASALAQEEADVRVVVVDDGSTDGHTPAQCDACAGDRVRVIHQSNTGLPGARNAGAEGATTEFLAFLDADDWVEPGFTRALAEKLADAPAASHAYCYERIAELGNDWVWKTPEWDTRLMLLTNLHPVTALVRRTCFEDIGGFDATMRDGYEDWEFWVRCAAKGWRGVRVPEALFVWRRHSHETMIADAVARHDRLFAQIVGRNQAFYAEHAESLIKRSNSLMRRFDVNWIDEDFNAIQLGFLRDRAEYLEQEVWATRGRLEQAQQATTEQEARTADVQSAADARERELLALLEAQSCALRDQRDAYESMTLVRLHHASHRVVSALPGPLARFARGVLGALGGLLKRIAPTQTTPKT